METASFLTLLDSVAAALEGRRSCKQFAIAPLGKGGLIGDRTLAASHAPLFPADAQADVGLLVNAAWWADYALPVIVDLPKALGLLRQSPERDANALATALTQARFGFMGTDGMRGKVAPSQAEPLKAYVGSNLLSPELISIAAEAFARQALSTGQAKAGDLAVVGNDGRDVAAGWSLNSAMHAGFAAAGLKVEDLGTMPTPYMPWESIVSAAPCAAALTASHNPSNQNGIKFFLKGRKLLPEGPLGDYALSAWMLDLAMPANGKSPALQSPVRGGGHRDDYLSTAVERTVAALPGNISEILAEQPIIVDSANGAFFTLAPAVLKRLKLSWTMVNTSADGANINKGCGVAEIEGHEHFSSSEADALPIVRALFDKGRSSKAKVWGIALDGDGDRGFVLVYDPAADEVLVLDGDRMGAVLAEHFLATGAQRDQHFVLTVESDLMTASHVRRGLKLPVGIVSVGDKWIGNYSAGSIMLGLEASGHLMYPVACGGKSGPVGTLLAGNGILGTLRTLYALVNDGWSMERIRHPYEPGFTKTFYTYFVDKSRFFNGSAAWQKDMELIRAGYSQAMDESRLSEATMIKFEAKEDSNMLYAAFYEHDDQVAAIFARNSGTEDKCAVYVQCRKGLENAFLPIGRKVAEYHRSSLKNPERLEFKAEVAVLQLLAEGVNDVAGILAEVQGRGIGVNADDLHGVLYGLKKEGRIVYENDKARLQ